MRNRVNELRVTVPGLSLDEIAAIKAIKKAGKYKNYSEFIQYLIAKYDAPSSES
jgi:Arc/MetJ-type ribon-helix-helix transcriptional regulator